MLLPTSEMVVPVLCLEHTLLRVGHEQSLSSFYKAEFLVIGKFTCPVLLE